MFDRVRAELLRLLRVPPDPEPPFGAPGSVRVFRAGRNFYKLRLFGWAAGQVGALVGIVFSLWFIHQLQSGTQRVQRQLAPTTNAPSSSVVATNETNLAPAAPGASKRGENWKRPLREKLRRLVARWPDWIFPLLSLLEYAGIGFYFIQALLTYAAVRLDFELRWYMVTDRSLRIRSGVWSVQEMTMSFANLQQVMVSQGPVQRLLGIADLRVESAGGGGAHDPTQGHEESMHTGVFHGVENANEIRDLILARLRSFRETGLGDPDETPVVSPVAAGQTQPPEVLLAARELLAETRSLRNALAGRP